MGTRNRILRPLPAATGLFLLAAAIALSSRAAEPQVNVVRALASAAASPLSELPIQPLTSGGDLLPQEPFPLPPELIGVERSKETPAESLFKKRGLIIVYKKTRDMHAKAHPVIAAMPRNWR
jgi:hypothetical protein